ncbi:urotensin-2 [Balaenoptera acutorostrata]|uniref:Urotensin-2 n=1 Tax=Balaenoptera acutorostrata TaxID=9767 RepID=A0A383Z4U3_BALAC|nr:urotensin-2 [Balaenoptera acutorostrata]
MYKLVSCCLLFIGCLNPLWSLPVLDSREEPLQLSDPGTNIFYPRGSARKAFSGQDPNISLSHLLARIRKPYKKRGTPSECFWKYCV